MGDGGSDLAVAAACEDTRAIELLEWTLSGLSGLGDSAECEDTRNSSGSHSAADSMSSSGGAIGRLEPASSAKKPAQKSPLSRQLSSLTNSSRNAPIETLVSACTNELLARADAALPFGARFFEGFDAAGFGAAGFAVWAGCVDEGVC